jgi:NADPH-dependent ferric siderophore reductase
VLRSERLSPHFARVTIGQDDMVSFTPMGFDQWFRLFIRVAGGSLERLPNKLNAPAYAKTSRPVLRTYSVRAHRPDGPELSTSTSSSTASPSTAPRSPPRPGSRTAHPAASTCSSWRTKPACRRSRACWSPPPRRHRHALIELPDAEDRQALDAPPGVEVTWLPRTRGAVPGALAAAQDLPVPPGAVHGWVVGESATAVALRRHWVRAGIPKNDIMFCGYWKARH